jgi:hypothetical protein
MVLNCYLSNNFKIETDMTINKKEIEKFLKDVFVKYKTGYFLCEINQNTSYIHNDYNKKDITVMYTTEDLTVLELKNFFEEKGKDITKLSDTDDSMVLEEALIDGTSELKLSSADVYMVNDNQVLLMNELMLELVEQDLFIEISPPKKGMVQKPKQ